MKQPLDRLPNGLSREGAGRGEKSQKGRERKERGGGNGRWNLSQHRICPVCKGGGRRKKKGRKRTAIGFSYHFHAYGKGGGGKEKKKVGKKGEKKDLHVREPGEYAGSSEA